MKEDKKLIFVYGEAYNFLKKKVGEDTLKKQLDYYYSYAPKSMRDIFKRIIETLKNKQGYVNFIAEIEQMDSILLKFNPQKVFRKFGDQWEILFNEFKNKFGKDYRMDIKNKRNAWVI